MLNITEKLSITGESVIDDLVVCSFSVLIDAQNPEKMIINQIKKDMEAYKANREVCRADFAAFEDHAFKKQAELIAAKAE